MTMERPAEPELEPSQDERTLELREEELVVHRAMQDIGQAHVRTYVEETPARLEVDAFAEEVHVEHVPMGQVVSERAEPYHEGDDLVVPVYEEQLVVTKRLILREQLRIRRVRTSQRQLFEDTVRRERVAVEDPDQTGLVHEQFPADADANDPDRATEEVREEGGLVNLVRRALQ
jgi:uncharacterized protein (TIGR02271 family)